MHNKDSTLLKFLDVLEEALWVPALPLLPVRPDENRAQIHSVRAFDRVADAATPGVSRKPNLSVIHVSHFSNFAAGQDFANNTVLDTALSPQTHAVEKAGVVLPFANGRVLEVQLVRLVDLLEDAFELLNGDGDQLPPTVYVLRGAAGWNAH